MREIKPEDVPFWICTVCSWRGPYSQSDPVMYKTIDWQNCPSCNAVAIPDPNGMPKLRDGDPVVCISDGNEVKRIFFRFEEDGSRIWCYPGGRNRWTTSNKEILQCWRKFRAPTKQELSESGYTEDQINEMVERWW